MLLVSDMAGSLEGQNAYKSNCVPVWCHVTETCLVESTSYMRTWCTDCQQGCKPNNQQHACMRAV
jgi:hypothetical protein